MRAASCTCRRDERCCACGQYLAWAGAVTANGHQYHPHHDPYGDPYPSGVD